MAMLLLRMSPLRLSSVSGVERIFLNQGFSIDIDTMKLEVETMEDVLGNFRRFQYRREMNEQYLSSPTIPDFLQK